MCGEDVHIVPAYTSHQNRCQRQVTLDFLIMALYNDSNKSSQKPGYESECQKKEGIDMENKKTLEEVRKFFEADRFATENGAVIDEIGDHSAVCSLRITDSHRNAMGVVMGGTYFMLADFAFAVAANWEQVSCVSLRSDISFLGAAKGERLIAKATCVKDGRTTACYRVDVTDDLGNLTAIATMTGYHI